MKRFFSMVCIFAVLQIAMINTACAETYLKIGLKYGNKSVSKCTLYSESGFYGFADGENVFSANEGKLTVKATETGIEIRGAENCYYSLNNGLQTVEITPASGEIIELDNIPYRGSVMFSFDVNGIKVINCVETESYLKSVVPSEMPASWHIEALKAQAVCARNYALSNLNKYKSYGFDMDDTTANQVYKGVNSENENSSKAVEETKGISLMHDGKLVQTFFYSSGAGTTEDVKNVWGSEIPYLKSVAVPGEEVREWEEVFTAYDLTERMKKVGIDIGNVQKIEITKRSEAGRVTEVIITGDKGEYKAEREKARTVFGLKSALYDIEVSGNKSELPDISGYSPAVQGAVLGKYIFELLLNPLGFTEDAVYTFKGKGNGHAVGLSQYGAKALAESGYTYEQILTHFYTGSYIESNQ